MKITEFQLRRLIREEIELINELDDDKPAKPGTETSTAEGSLDVKRIADTLGIDASALKTAVTNIRANKRSTKDDKVFGDMVAKLINASPDDTVKVMNVLKKVEKK